MRTIEFEADVKDGSIAIPAEYRELVGSSVHVTLSSRESDIETSLTILDQWLASPIRLPVFRPLGREQAHDR